MSGNYSHMEDDISDFFNKKSMPMVFEPFKLQGPDAMRAVLCAEIKHKAELKRDLKRRYWRDWNSDESVGGKPEDYKIKDDFDDTIEDLTDQAKGWVCVIFGQLKHYCNVLGVCDGWLIIENYKVYEESINEAIDFLAINGKCHLNRIETINDIGYIFINYW